MTTLPMPEPTNGPERSETIDGGDGGGLLAQLSSALQYQTFVVALSHLNYLDSIGGTELYMLDEAGLLANRQVSYLQLYPAIPRENFSGSAAEFELNLYIDSKPLGRHRASDIVRLAFSLMVGTGRVCLSMQVHHLLGWNMEVVRTIIDAFQPVQRVFFVHDYFSICPQYNLMYNDEYFCHVPTIDSSICRSCHYGTMRWRTQLQFRQLFDEYSFTIVAPSAYAQTLWLKQFPQATDQCRVTPHMTLETNDELVDLELRIANQTERLRIAFVGRPLAKKGWLVWRDFVDNCDIANQYELFHLGSGGGDYAETFEAIRVAPNNRMAMVNSLRRHNIDIVFHWTLWPETFSYVLYEAIAAGCFILTGDDSGHVADYVREHETGEVFESQADLIDFLRDIEPVKTKLTDFRRRHPTGYGLSLNSDVVDFICNEQEQS